VLPYQSISIFFFPRDATAQCDTYCDRSVCPLLSPWKR